MHKDEFFRHDSKLKPEEENTRQYNREILGGISNAQWQAFTIEEEFSGCKLSSSTFIPDTRLCPPLAEILHSGQQQWKKCSKECFGSENETTLDIQKLLDIELLRIFIKYEAENTPGGFMTDKKHLDLCAALIGRSLKKDIKGELVGSDGSKSDQGTGTNECSESENIASNKQDIYRKSMEVPGSVLSGESVQSKSGGCLEEDLENINYKMEQKELKHGSQEGESWPLLMSIMQLDILPSKTCASIENNTTTGRSKFSYIF